MRMTVTIEDHGDGARRGSAPSVEEDEVKLMSGAPSTMVASA